MRCETLLHQEPFESLDITIMPAIREGILVEVRPQPTVGQAEMIGNQFANTWAEMCQQYRDVVAKIIGDQPETMKFASDEIVVQRNEGNTRVTDFPSLVYSGNICAAFETRICVAICTGKKSTKCWSRVCPPTLKGSHVRNRFRLDELKGATERFENIAIQSAKWLGQIVADSIKNSIGTDISRINQWGRLEIISLGVKDKALEVYFQTLLDENDDLTKIVETPDLRNRLMVYLREVCGDPDSLCEANESGEVTNQLRLISPHAVDVENGYKENRVVLYFVREANREVAQVLGIAFDDSVDGSLALVSGAKIARWIGVLI